MYYIVPILVTYPLTRSPTPSPISVNYPFLDCTFSCIYRGSRATIHNQVARSIPHTAKAYSSATATSSSKKSRGKAKADRVKPTQRRCGNCGGAGHNAQTCQNNEESTIESSSDEELEIDYSEAE